MKKRVFIILIGSMMLTVLLCFFSITSARSELTDGECSPDYQEFLSVLPGNVEGYEKAATLKLYSGNSLFDYMNGNAHYYFEHGFVCLGVQEYRKNKKAFLLEFYQFKDRNGARNIFSDETYDNKNKLDIGEGGSFAKCFLAFYLKNYYVKLMCFEDWKGEPAKVENQQSSSVADLIELAKSMEKAIIQLTGGRLANSKKDGNGGLDLNKKNNRIILIGASYAKGWSLEEIAGLTVINKGISGEQSFEMLARFQEDVISLKPGAAIIWGFINDIHRSKRENIDATIVRAKNSFEEMVQLSIENGIMPILATEVTIRAKDSWSEAMSGWIGSLLGKKSYQDYVNRYVLEVNQWLRNYSEQNDLLLLDLQPIISDKNNIRKKEYATKDGTHISEKGYEKLTEYTTSVFQGYFQD